MKKIVFVCHGNICRSPMAEYIMKHLLKQKGLQEEYLVCSRATSCEEIGNDIYPQAKRKLDQKGIEYARHSAQRLQSADRDRFDLFVGMDDANVRNMQRILGGGNICKLLDFCGGGDVQDPWWTGDFESAYRDISRGVEALLESLQKGGA